MEDYLIDELYVATVAPLKYKRDENGVIVGNSIIVDEDYKYKAIVSNYNERYYDSLSEEYYMLYDKMTFDDRKDSVGEFCVLNIFPLRLVTDVFELEVDKEELVSIFKEINQNNRLFDGEISDEFLIELITLRDSISPNIDNDLKQEYINKILSLAEAYVNSVIQTGEFESNQINKPLTVDECYEMLEKLKEDIAKSNDEADFPARLTNELETFSDYVNNGGFVKIKNKFLRS